MSFAKHGIASQSVDLGKTVLALSALGLFAKLLHIDLTQLQVLGVSLRPASAGLIPGFIGLALMYAFLAFTLARFEAAVEQQTDKDIVGSTKQVTESRPLMALTLFVLPVSIMVYSMPFILGLLAITLLWSDSMAVLRAVVTLAIH